MLLPGAPQAAHSLLASTGEVRIPVDKTAEPASALAPLRSQPRILRLWVKPWEDSEHDLVEQGYIYVQIDNGQWLIDHAQQAVREAYAPVRPPRPSQVAEPLAQLPAHSSSRLVGEPGALTPTTQALQNLRATRPVATPSTPSAAALGGIR